MKGDPPIEPASPGVIYPFGLSVEQTQEALFVHNAGSALNNFWGKLPTGYQRDGLREYGDAPLERDPQNRMASELYQDVDQLIEELDLDQDHIMQLLRTQRKTGALFLELYRYVFPLYEKLVVEKGYSHDCLIT